MANTDTGEQVFEPGSRVLNGNAKWVVRVSAVLILVLAINQTFNFGFFIGYTLIDLRFYYAILALALAALFLIYPANPNEPSKQPAWHDWALAAACLITCAFFFVNAFNIALKGWEMPPPPQTAIWFAVAL